MRFDRLAMASAMVIACAALPAHAAIFVGSATATGTTSTTTCKPTGPFPCPTMEGPDQLTFDFTFDLVDGNWATQQFSIYDPITLRQIRGTVVSLGNGAFRGENLSLFNDYGTGKQCATRPQNCTYIETRLSAPTFSVTQVSPPPVPEPKTWAMMIVGFIVAGRVLRRRRTTGATQIGAAQIA